MQGLHTAGEMPGTPVQVTRRVRLYLLYLEKTQQKKKQKEQFQGQELPAPTGTDRRPIEYVCILAPAPWPRVIRF